MIDSNDRLFTRAELEAVQDEYERETGERPSLEVADVLLDRQREADSYRDEYTVEEALRDARDAEEEEKARKEDEAECAAGTCDHYTCTEGRSLDEWDEPEPTAWDYESEVDRGGDSAEDLEHEAICNFEAEAKKGEAK
tara:strand:- start:653 stop:1069 length:417 start_codon:yes stop_codon:yes gene_type:complete